MPRIFCCTAALLDKNPPQGLWVRFVQALQVDPETNPPYPDIVWVAVRNLPAVHTHTHTHTHTHIHTYTHTHTQRVKTVPFPRWARQHQYTNPEDYIEDYLNNHVPCQRAGGGAHIQKAVLCDSDEAEEEEAETATAGAEEKEEVAAVQPKKVKPKAQTKKRAAVDESAKAARPAKRKRQAKGKKADVCTESETSDASPVKKRTDKQARRDQRAKEKAEELKATLAEAHRETEEKQAAAMNKLQAELTASRQATAAREASQEKLLSGVQAEVKRSYKDFKEIASKTEQSFKQAKKDLQEELAKEAAAKVKEATAKAKEAEAQKAREYELQAQAKDSEIARLKRALAMKNKKVHTHPHNGTHTQCHTYIYIL